MNTKRNILKATLLLISLMLVNVSFGQKGVDDGSRYGKGQDSIDCLTNTSLYREYVKQKAYNDAVKFWRHCFNDCPASSRNVYLDGVRIFKDLHKKELDLEKKEKYADTVILIYNQRIKYEFGDEAYVNQYKGLDLLQLRNDDTEALKEAYTCFNSSINGLGKKALKPVFQNVVRVGIILYNQSELDLETLLKDYLVTLEVLEEKGDDKLITEVNDQMVNEGILSCQQIIDIYTPKYKESPNDKKLLITITDFLDKLNCEDSELYYKALSGRHKIEPTSESSKMLAALANKKSNYDDGLKYAKQAIDMESDDKVKAELYLLLSEIYSKKGNMADSRSSALTSAKLNPASGEPYLKIGMLYAESNTDCSDPLKNAAYWAAVDMFVKAKRVDATLDDRATKLISTYSVYYPNKEDAFFLGIKDGDSFKVGCWINETTTARFND